MLRISKSLFGELQVTTLDRQYLKPQKPSRFSYYFYNDPGSFIRSLILMV
jgi:hypothetical protein